MNYHPPKRSDGTSQKRRVQLPWPADKPFRILSIDGGGICGILPASILAETERRFLGGESISNHFDMIAGTSTGGIIALALSLGMTAAQARDIYMDRGGIIFPPASGVTALIRRARRLRRYVYDSDVLEGELRRVFTDHVFGDSKVRLCIPSFEGLHGEPWLFKTPHHPDYKKDQHEKMVRVGLATSAAPTYFHAQNNGGYVMVDGGIWANNPVMNAVVDVLTCYNIRREQIQVLSLGCGETTYSVSPKHAIGGMWHWRGVISAAMKAQSHNALGQTRLLLGNENVLRLDAPESAKPIELDDYLRAKNELPSMARILVEATGKEIERTFLHSAADRYARIAL